MRRTDRAPCSRCLPTCRHCARPRAPAVRHWLRSPRASIGLRQRELALGRYRRFVFEPGPDGRVVATVVPKRCLDAPAQEGLRRPARIGRDERAIALDGSAIVVAAQDDPFRELAGDRIRYRGLRPGVASAGLCLRTSSMTFSSASLSACEVDGRRCNRCRRRRLARIGQGGMLARCGREQWRRRGGRGRCRRGGCRRGMGGGGRAGVCSRAWRGRLGSSLGTTLRAIGRGFGNGTFGLAQASAADGSQPHGQRQARRQCRRSQGSCAGDGVTAFLCGDKSVNRSSLRSI